jgi:hypothetical protein
MSKEIVPYELIESKIVLIRGHRVILDFSLAEIYGTTTKRLNEQIQRNIKRFPEDFRFQLTPAEEKSLRSQFATSKGRGGRRYLPFAFTEYGAIQAANAVNTETAILASIAVVRAFVRIREMVSAHKELALKLAELERRLGGHDEEIKAIVDVIRQLMNGMSQPEGENSSGPKKQIGFRPAQT